MQCCKTVNLRCRDKKGGMKSVFIEFYPGYRDPETMELIRRKALGIYIYAKPSGKREKEYNSMMMEKAEAIRCKVYMDVINERYEFFSKEKLEDSFLDFFYKLTQKKHSKWEFSYKHFKKFTGGKCSFGELDVPLCRKFQDYLMTGNTLSRSHVMNQNTASDYWAIFKSALFLAYRDKKIKENLVDYLDWINGVPTVKESLTLEELRRLYHTPCKFEEIKKAAIFSCMTGIRRSDIINLTWDNVFSYADGGKYVEFICQKTKRKNTVPLSDETYNMILPRTEGKIFKGFTKEMSGKKMKDWIKSAGITKHITFHCFRHTYASLQLELGTDIYTVQHLLAHKSVSTTQIYVCHADPKTRDAANRISLEEKPENLKTESK